MKKILFIYILLFIGVVFWVCVNTNHSNIEDIPCYEDPVTKRLSFMVSYTKYHVYTNTNNPSLIGTYDGIDEYEFIEYNGPVTLSLSLYFIKTCFGKLYVHNERLFYTITDGKYQYYKIVGEKDFSFFGRY